jgi:hypothetical protein
MVEAFTVPALAIGAGNGDGVDERDELFGIGGLPGCDASDQAAAASIGE